MTPKFDALLFRDLIWRAQTSTDAEHLLRAVCDVLCKHKFPIWRASLGLEFLHPEVSGALTVWTDGQIDGRLTERAGILQSNEYLNSPTRIVDETEQPFVRQLDRPLPEMPLLERLREQGATGYVMFPLPFLNQSRSATLSFSTRAAGGFSQDDVALLKYSAEAVSPYAERQVLQRIAADLLDTYLGPRIGRRVLSGEIERGHLEMIEAAVWFADLRGFTAISEMLPVNQVLAVLDQWFDSVHGTVTQEGGDVLKFMGDGALAIFPVADHGSAELACRRAFAASRDLVQMLAKKLMFENWPWSFGIGLHIGQVAYGNIGASHRLDFTVIGPAVNMAARLEKLTKVLKCHVVASAEFQQALGSCLEDGGSHELSGVKGRRRVFFAMPRKSSGL